jgi:hypothetical protein
MPLFLSQMSQNFTHTPLTTLILCLTFQFSTPFTLKAISATLKSPTLVSNFSTSLRLDRT